MAGEALEAEQPLAPASLARLFFLRGVKGCAVDHAIDQGEQGGIAAGGHAIGAIGFDRCRDRLPAVPDAGADRTILPHAGRRMAPARHQRANPLAKLLRPVTRQPG